MKARYVFALSCVAASFPAFVQELQFKGVCDASAAVALDEDHFVVADDETSAVLVYSVSEPDKPVLIDLTQFLGPTDESREPDIEGAARIGDRIYWIGSHGLNSDAEPQQ